MAVAAAVIAARSAGWLERLELVAADHFVSVGPRGPADSAHVAVVHVTDASRVRHMLEHHGYYVVASFGEDEDDEDLLYRIQEFMRYLEV